MRGEPVGMTAGGIAMTAEDATEAHAVFEREQRSLQPATEALEAARIRALTDAYFENERRGKRAVKVGEESIYGW